MSTQTIDKGITARIGVRQEVQPKQSVDLVTVTLDLPASYAQELLNVLRGSSTRGSQEVCEAVVTALQLGLLIT